MSATIKPGDVVKYREPFPDEEGERYRVLEVLPEKQAGRDFLPVKVVIQYVCEELPFPGIETALLSEVELA